MPLTPPGRDPLSAALSLAWTVLLVCLLLWAAVWLIQQIWVWLLVGLIVTAAVVVSLTWYRSRQDRW